MAQHRDVKLRKLFLQHARSVCKVSSDKKEKQAFSNTLTLTKYSAQAQNVPMTLRGHCDSLCLCWVLVKPGCGNHCGNNCCVEKNNVDPGH